MILTLNRGQALIDDEDFDRIKKFHWYVEKRLTHPYVVASTFRKGIKGRVSLHRVIMRARRGQIVDHINGNTLDNRKANLRLCAHHENLANQKKRASRSKFKGVAPLNGKWRAKITVHRKDIWLGLFTTEVEAAHAYDSAAARYFGEFARPNLQRAGVTR